MHFFRAFVERTISPPHRASPPWTGYTSLRCGHNLRFVDGDVPLALGNAEILPVGGADVASHARGGECRIVN